MCIKRKKGTENVKIKKLLSHEKERKNVLLYYCYNYNAYFEKSYCCGGEVLFNHCMKLSFKAIKM